MTKKKDVWVRLDLRASSIHGRGVFASADIPEGTGIGRYGGRRVSVEDDRWPRPTSTSEPTYAFVLSDGSYIDGAHGGNLTRFINHSCEPNCIAYEVQGSRGLGVEIMALRSIAQGEELLLDYQLDIAASDADRYPCHCGTRECRGTMAAQELGAR